MDRPLLLTELQAILSAEQVSISQADRDLHAADQSAFPASPPDLVVWPTTTAEISAILRYANSHQIPVTAWGAGSSLEGNPIPLQGGIVLSLVRMNQILELHTEDFQVTVQPGVLYKDMNKILAQAGLFFPPDPGANASIGGMLANNAAGTRTVKYGATRDNVLALEVVLTNGDVVRTGSRTVKQSSGYDLTHLFVGSEGTLGIISAATLKLWPIPEHISAATAAFASVEEAARAVYEIIGSGLEPNALELLDEVGIEIINAETSLNLYPSPNLFMEFSSASAVALTEQLPQVEAICRENGCVRFEAGLGRDLRQRLWEARHSVFEAHLRHFPGQDYIVTDTAVPISRYAELVTMAKQWLQANNVTGSIISHAGDGNVHVTMFFAADDTAAREKARQINEMLVLQALELGGTITGEHGVGIGKQKYMQAEHGVEALSLMRKIKALLDPNNILNPGKVVGLAREANKTE